MTANTCPDAVFTYLFIYPRQKDHVTSYTVGKSRYIMTYTIKKKQKKWKKWHKHNDNVTVYCNTQLGSAYPELLIGRTMSKILMK